MAQSTHAGHTNYHAGLAAEDRVASMYEEMGYQVLARRWRGEGGEIDLIACRGNVIAFVEVKKARCFARAAQSLRHSQMRRIAVAAEEFLGTQPDGSLTECSFDVGLVDQSGGCDIIENAFGLY